jgi:hypothetical protein
VTLASGTGYLIRDADGVRVGVTFAGAGNLAGYTVRSPREADSAIVIRP